MVGLSLAGLFGVVSWMVEVVPWTVLAFLAYLANISVGTASARGRRVGRKWHSRVFLVTCVLTAVAAVFSFPDHWERGLWLLLALVPLVLLPYLGIRAARRTRRHALLALMAMPCYLAALILWAAGLG
jgi:cytochrome bd-type quinol oxidase subunit 2